MDRVDLPPRGSRSPRRSVRPAGIAIAAVAILAIAGFGGFAVVQGLGAASSPGPSGPPAPTNGQTATGPVTSSSTGRPSGASGSTPEPGTTPAAAGTPAPAGEAAMPIVPVVGFWSVATDISTADLKAALQGQSATYRKVSVSGADRDAIGRALGVTIASSVRSANAAAVVDAVRTGALGLLRAPDVGPNVRALSIDGTSLFGEGRVTQTSDWPMLLNVQAPPGREWDQAKAWTLVAGGDMFLDRGVRRMVLAHGRDPDYPFDGGTARVTGHHCCGLYVTNYVVPDVQLTGNNGAVRALTTHADLMIANLENPVPDNWVYHAHDYTFSGDPGLLPMFVNAGVDWVTLANNHIMDFGSSGVADTRKNVAAAGLGLGGAGRNIAEAGKISYLQANGTRVAIIACLGAPPGPGAWASAGGAGALPCSNTYILPRIREAKKNADVVIVFPHWGIEYNRTPLASQRSLAGAWVAAGADLILGAHSHVAGAMEEVDGHVVLYSLGNFIFDQDFRTIAMESFLPEMTFDGDRLVQLTLHPYVMADQAQPNLLDPATDDGKALLKSVRQASPHLGW